MRSGPLKAAAAVMLVLVGCDRDEPRAMYYMAPQVATPPPTRLADSVEDDWDVEPLILALFRDAGLEPPDPILYRPPAAWTPEPAAVHAPRGDSPVRGRATSPYATTSPYGSAPYTAAPYTAAPYGAAGPGPAGGSGAGGLEGAIENLLADPLVRSRLQRHPELWELVRSQRGRYSLDDAMEALRRSPELAELARELLADPALLARLQSDPAFRELWSDPRVHGHLQRWP